MSFQPLARGLPRRRGPLLPGRHGGIGHIHDGRATASAELNELRQVGPTRAQGQDKGLGGVVHAMRCPHCRVLRSPRSTWLTKVPDRSVLRQHGWSNGGARPPVVKCARDLEPGRPLSRHGPERLWVSADAGVTNPGIRLSKPVTLHDGARSRGTRTRKRHYEGFCPGMRRPVRSTILVVAGGTITVHGRVQEDATLASGSVLVLRPIGDDLRVTGGTVEVASAVGATSSSRPARRGSARRSG